MIRMFRLPVRSAQRASAPLQGPRRWTSLGTTVLLAASVLTVSAAATVITAPAASAAQVNCTPTAGYTNCAQFTYSGANQTFTVPANITTVNARVFGAGGGGADSSYYTQEAGGAGGGFASGTLATTPGGSLTIVVGQGGNNGTAGIVNGYGGGGAGGTSLLASPRNGASGGGFSGIFNGNVTQANAAIIAGGGGGASPGADTNTPQSGGGGGASGGGDAANAGIAGQGGTQTAGGAAASTVGLSCSVDLTGAQPGTALAGGRGASLTGLPGTTSEAGGGGGGGYFGGGGGRCQDTNLAYNGPGGGGSGYTGGVTGTVQNNAGTNGFATVPGTAGSSGGTGDSQYVAGVGKGGAVAGTGLSAGGNGLVVLQWSSSYSVTKSASVGSVVPGSAVTYTIQVANTGQNAFSATSPAGFTDNEAGITDDAGVGAASSNVPGWTFSTASSVLTGSGPLAVGQTATITYSATVQNPDNNGDQSLKNTAAPLNATGTCGANCSTSTPVSQVATSCPSAVALGSGSFETPGVNGTVQDFNNGTAGLVWRTTESDGQIELWHSPGDSKNNGYPISAQDGVQWAELNANDVGALYQDQATTPGQVLRYSLWHRARSLNSQGTSANDVMQVQIGSTTSQTPVVPNNNGGSANISDGPTKWVNYTGSYTVPAGQTTTRFQFAAISTASGDPTVGNFLDNISLASVPCDAITKTVTNTTSGAGGLVRPGDVLQYNLAVANNGGSASSATTLQDAIPTGTTYVPQSLVVSGAGVTDATGDDTGYFAGGAVNAYLGTGATSSAGGTFAVGATTNVSFKVTVNAADTAGTSFANNATMAYTWPPGVGTLKSTSNTVTSTVDVPAITMVKSVASSVDANSNGRIDPGDTITYNFKVTNSGSTTLTGVAVNDSKASAVTCPSTTLAAGASQTCTGTYVVTAADGTAGTLVNTATASGTPPLGAATITSAPSSVTTPIQVPGLTVTKTPATQTISAANSVVGTVVTQTITATNTGNTALTAVSVSDVINAPATSPNPDSATCSVAQPAALAVGASYTCTVTHSLTQTDIDNGSVSDTAGATGTPPAGSNVTAAANATATITPAPVLTLTKSASPTTITGSGKAISYTILAKNTGNVTLTSLAVVDTMNAPATGTPAVTCPVATLAPGASTSCTATYTSTQADVDSGTISNTATGTAKTPKNATVTAAPSSAMVMVTPGPALSVTKTASRTTVDASGQTITYTITATNSGNVTLSNVSVADALTAPAGPGPTPTCSPTTPATLAPGAAISCSVVYTTTQADLDNGKIVNTATATGTAPGGAAGAITGTAAVTVTATRAPALTLVKSANRTSVTAAGQAINYTFLVTNTGNVTVSGIAVSDALTAPASPVPTVTCPATTSLAPGGTLTCTATYTSTQPDVDSGTITDTGKVTGTGAGGGAVTASSTVTVNATASSTISLTESANRTTVTAAGQAVVYSFLVTNTGTATLTNVAIVDGFTSPAGPVPSISCPATTLAPNASTTCTGTYTTTQADVDKGTIVNTSTASGKNPSGTTVTSPSSAVTITATQSPSLTVAKTASPTSATTAGQTVNYAFAVTNNGNVTVTGIVVADTFTAPAAPALTITCPATTLAPAATTNCTGSYTVTQADVDAGSIKNSATVSGKDPTNTTITSTPSTATVTIARSPKLTLVKSASPTTVTTVGQKITYSFAVTNTGNVTETGVGINDTFTAPAGPVPSISCPAATLAPGAGTTCTASYTTTAADFDAGSINNSATATAKDPTNATTTSAASTASVSATQSASLSLAQAISPANFNKAGQQLSYTYTVTNTGNVTVNNIATGVTFQAPGGPSSAVTCLATSLAAGAATTCTSTYTVTQADVDNGSVNTTAAATGKDPNGVAVASNTTTGRVPAVQSPALSVVKSASPTSVSALGQTVSYSFLVTNTGNVTITGVSIADSFTAPAGPVPNVTCPATTLAPNATTTCTASYSTTQADLDAGSITNSATASGTGPGGATTTSPASSASVSVTRTTALSIVQSASPAAVSSVGQNVALSFVVTNNSNVTVTSVAVADTLTGPAGPNPTVTCPSTTLAPGASTTCTASYTTTQADLNAGSIRSSGVATATAAGGGTVTSAASVATVTATQNPKLSLTKSASPSSVPVIGAVGTTITYTYAVTNTGNVGINTLAVTDTVTQGTGTATAVACTTTTLAVGASTNCTNTYVVTSGDVTAGSIANTASATGRSPANAAVTSNSSSVTVPVASALSLTLSKTASPTTVTAAGQTINYSFAVTNSGTLTVTGLAIADTFTSPAGPVPTITCPATTLAAGASTTCTGTYTVTVADMNKGSIANSATASANAVQGGVTVTTTSNTSTATVTATQSPKLTVTNVPNPTTITAPGNVGYSFVVTNTGNVSITGIAVAQSYTAPGGPAPTITCPATTLVPGAATTCTATYAATQTDIDAGSIVTSAVATGRDPGNNAISSGAAPSTVTVTQTKTLSLVKTAVTNPPTNPTSVSAVGASVAYTFTVKNTGNVTITAVSIVDTFSAPAGPALSITCSSTTLAPGASCVCTGTYTATQADLDAGSINNSAIASGKDPAGATVTSNTSTATVAATQNSTLALTTTGSPATVSAVGSQVTYTYAVTNTGNVSVTGLTVAPSFVAPAAPNPTVTCRATSLAPGGGTTCTATYTVTQSDLDNGSIVSTATANANRTGGTTASNTTTTTTGVTSSPALTVAKTASPTTISAPGTITYSFVVKNTGNVTIKTIAVTDTFTAPAGPGSAVSCPAATLAPGASTTCTSTYAATQADIDSGAVGNSATVAGLTPAGASVTSPASTATVTVVPTPTLTISQSVAPTPVTSAGTALTYSFVVKNTGNVTVTGISVADTFTSPAAPALTITCPNTTLAPGASFTCTAPYTTTQPDVDKGSIVNVATATGKAPSGSTVTSPSSTGTLPIAAAPAATVTNVANPTTVTAAGQTVNYSFVLKNTGNVTLTNPTLADSFTSPGGPAPTVTCPTVTLAPGVSTTCTAGYTVSQADVDKGSIVNSVIGTLSTPAGGSTSTAAAASTVTVTQTAGLTLAKSASPTTVTVVGQSVTYSFVATNTGNTTLTGLAINDSFTAPAAPALTITCPATTLAPSQVTTCTGTYKVTQNDLTAGLISNSATASATRPGGVTLTSSASTATVAVTQSPQLSLSESANPTTVTAAGQQISYSFPVTNGGNVPLTNLVVTATASAPAGPAPVVSCPATSLAAGASTTCTATYTTTQADVDKGSVVISSVATAQDTNRNVVTSPTASVTVPVTQSAALTLVQTRTPATVTAAGQTVNYSFAVTNSGNVTVSTAGISDTLTAPAGPALSISCPASTLAPGVTTTCTAAYTVTQLDMDKGAIVNSATATAKDPNNASVSSNATSTSVTATRAPALTVVKTANPTTVTTAGQTIGYSFLVTNTGNVTLTSPKINDTFTSPAGPVPTITCPAANVRPGTTTNCTGTYTATQDDVDKGTIVNSATASAIDPTGVSITSAASTATVTATASPKLTVTNTAGPTTISKSGASISYSFVVTNTGNVTVTGIAIGDSFTAPGGPVPTITCSATTLAPNSTTTCTATYTATQADIDAGSIVNSATASGKDPSGATTTSAAASSTVTVASAPGLTVVNTAAPTSVSAAGQTVNYTFAVKNTGNVTVSTVAISDNVTAPAGALGPITCGATTLAPNATTNCTGSYVTTQADIDNGSIVNTATATGVTPNNQPVTSPASQSTVTVTQSASMTLVKSATGNATAVGSTINYSFLVGNTGNVTLSLIAVADKLTAPAGPEITVTCPSRTLAPGGTTTCTGTYTVTQADVDSGSVNNSASVTAQDPQGRPVSSGGSGASTPITQTASLKVAVAATPASVNAVGQTVTLTYTVTNNGNVSDTGLAIATTFAAPSGTGSQVTCQSTSLAPGASTTCSSTYVVTQADLDNGSIAATSAGSAQGAGGAAITAPIVNTTVPVTVSATLTVAKTANPLKVADAGDVVTYAFAVRNTGNVTLSSLTIADTFVAPAGPGTAIGCDATTLAPAATTTCRSTYTTTAADVVQGSIKNTAVANAQTPTGTPVASAGSSAVVSVNQDAALQLDKTADKTTVSSPGQVINYSFVVTNTGNLPLTGVAVSDQQDVGAASAATCPSTQLAPDASFTCTMAHTVTQADLDRGSVNDSASATGTDSNNATATSNTSSVTVGVTTAAALGLTVATATNNPADPTTYTAIGQTITYTYTLTNNGNQTLANPTVSDSLVSPAGPAPTATCAAGPLAPGASLTCTAVYTVTQADINAGSVRGSAIAGATDPQNNPVNSATVDSNVAAVQTEHAIVTQMVSPNPVSKAGDQITYTYTITETGNVSSTGTTVIDTMTAPAGPPPSITCSSQNLSAANPITCTGVYTVTQADIDNGSITNSAVFSGVPPDGVRRTGPPETSVVNVTPNPSLTEVETGSPTSVSSLGQSVTYTFVVTNNGNKTVTGVGVNQTFTAPAGSGSAVSCPSTTLAPGASTTCTSSYTVTQADLDNGSIVDTSSASGTDPGGAAVLSPQTGSTIAVASTSKLTAVATATPGQLTGPGQAVTFSVAVTNAGNVTVNTVTVGQTFTGSGTAPVITCPSGALAPGKTVTCTGTYTSTQADVDAGSITDTATASGTAAGGAAVKSAASAATVTFADNATLTLSTTVSTQTVVKAGDPITYTFTATNTGNTTLSALALTSTFTAPAGPALNITCSGATVAPGASVVCTASYTTTQADIDRGSIRESATAAAMDPSGNAVGSAPSATTVGATRGGALTVVKTADMATVSAVGTVITYSFAVKNTGNLTLSSLGITDSLTPPAGPSFQVTCPVTTLAPGGTTTCQGTYKVTQADLDNGVIGNSATAGAVDTRGNQFTSAASTASVTVTRTSTLTLTESAAPMVLTGPDQTVNYTFTATNTGNQTLTGLAIADHSSSASPDVTVTCPSTTLAPGTSVTCTASYTSTQADVDAGSIVDTAVATAATPTKGTATSNTTTQTVTITQYPGLNVANVLSPSSVNNVGDKIAMTVVVLNSGNTTVTGITASEVMTAPAGPNPTVTCPVASLLPGQSTKCTATYTVTQADVDSGLITANATAAGTSAGGPVASNADPASVTVNRTGVLAVTTAVSTAGVANPGDPIKYTFTATNNGNTSLSALALASTFTAPAGPMTVTCPNTTVEPGTSVVCTGTYITTQADFDNGTVAESTTGTATGPTGTITSSPSKTSVTLPTKAALSVVATTDVATVNAVGDPVVYTYQVTNSGNLTLSTVAIADTFANPADPAMTVTCTNAATLAPGDSITCTGTHATTQADLDAGTIANTATATAMYPPGALIRSAPVSATVTATGTPGLSLTETSPPVAPAAITAAGQKVTYTFTATNTGNLTLRTLAVTDRAGAANSPVTVTCTATTLAPGAQTTCTGSYVATQADVDAGTIVDTSLATASTQVGAKVTSDPAGTTVPVTQAPGLTVTSSAAPTPANKAGQQITLSVVVTNSGNTTVTGVSATEAMVAPAGPNPTVTCPSTTVAPGKSVTCTAVYTVTQADVDNGSITAVAGASAGGPGGPVDAAGTPLVIPVTQTSGLTTRVTSTPVAVTAVGQQVSVTFAVTNTGNLAVDGLTVGASVAAPGGPAPVVTCAATSAAPGATVLCTAVYTATAADLAAGMITITGNASGVTAPGGKPVTAPAATLVIPAGGAALHLSKSAGPATDTNHDGRIDAGDTVVFTYTLQNTGKQPLTGVKVDDPLIGTLNCSTSPTGVISAALRSAAAVLPPLKPGQTLTCTAPAYKITQADMNAGLVGSSATATALDANGNVVKSNGSATSTPLTRSAKLVLVKKGTVTDVNHDRVTDPGDTIAWTFMVTNTGTVTIAGVGVSDPTAGTVTCQVTTLAPGASTTCAAVAKHTITAVDVAAGGVSNTATPVGACPSGSSCPPVVDVLATVRVLVKPAPVVPPAVGTLGVVLGSVVTDTNGDGVVDPGDVIGYTLKVTNTGTGTVTGVGAIQTGFGTIACSAGSIPPGGTITCAVPDHLVSAADGLAGVVDTSVSVTGFGPGGVAVGPITGRSITAVSNAPAPAPNPNPGPNPGPNPAPAPSPHPPLSYTGAGPVEPLLLAAILAILTGLGLMVIARNRRRRGFRS